MRLVQWQQQFWQALHEPSLDNLKDLLINGELNQASTRMHIYRDSMQASLQRSLQKIYPACQRLVGEDFFAQLSQDYIAAYPSTAANLNRYGHEFAAFCSTYSHLETIPYFADLAVLEWTWHTVFYGPNNTPQNPSTIHQLLTEKSEQVRLFLPTGAMLFSSDYAVDLIWQACQKEYQGKFDFTLEQSTQLLLMQTQEKIYMPRLSPEEWQFLNFVEGQSLLEICKHYEDQNHLPSQILPILLHKQLIYIE